MSEPAKKLTQSEAHKQFDIAARTLATVAERFPDILPFVERYRPADDHVVRCKEFDPGDLEKLRACLDTAKSLLKRGFARSRGRQLWVLLQTDPARFVDLGYERGKILTLEGAIRARFGTRYELTKAIEDGRLEEISIFGEASFRVLFEDQLRAVKRANVKAKEVKPRAPGMKTISELCELVGAEKKWQRIDVGEHAELWREQGKLASEEGRCVIPFKTGREINRATRFYDGATFEKLWAPPPPEVIAEVKRLVGSDGASADTIRDFLRGRGITGRRARKAIQAVGRAKPLGRGKTGSIIVPLAAPIRDIEQRPHFELVAEQGRYAAVINGNRKRLLFSQYCCIKALCDAGENGLTKDNLSIRSGCTNPLGILRRMAKTDQEWGALIVFPGKRGKTGEGGYRLKLD